jgi:hypothetical protein
MMGVTAEKTKLSTAEQQSAKVIRTVVWPQSGLTGKGGYYSIADRQNNVFALVNAMQKAGGQVFLQHSSGQPPQWIFAAHAQLAANAEKLHLALAAIPDLPKGSSPLKAVRVALYKPYVASMDEGWTRFVLEQYGFNIKNIENKQVRAGNLNAAFDVVILPDTSREIITEGRQGREGYFEDFPPEYSGGIGKEGVRALRDFVDKGGTLITLAHSSELVFGEEFNLPVRNAVSGAAGRGAGAGPASAADFNVPGSLLRVYVDGQHPVGFGMPREVAAFVDAPLAFQTTSPGTDTERSVIAWYPDDAKDMLLSGYAHGAERLERKAAVVSFTRGKGKIVMFGFRVQHRAQTEGTFQMLFNAIEWAGMD